MLVPYTSPRRDISAFNCPYCGAFAKQEWFDLTAYRQGSSRGFKPALDAAFCAHCGNHTVWNAGEMIVPPGGAAPMAHPELPAGVAEDYEEARSIVAASPRGAAALLRLVIQKLCIHLGEKGKDLNEDIGKLVKKGLPEQIQRSLDIVRVIGNNAVHPGQINIQDDPEIAQRLFELVNLIVEVMVSQPKRIEELYGRLPEGARGQIEKRDSR